MNRLACIAGLALVAASTQVARAADSTALCVTNASVAQYYFTVRGIDSSVRVGRDLVPGETLCLSYAGRGAVAAFESAESLEGCSRLARPGTRETLVAFARFDRCAWVSSND